MRIAEIHSSPAASRPQGAGSPPQTAQPRRGLRYVVCLGLVTAITAMGGVACESSTDASGSMAPVVLALSQNTAAYYSDPNLTIYWPSVPVKLPVKQGTGTEPKMMPYPAAPYLLNTDYQLQVNYTVTNLDNTSHAVWVTMNPWNQFVRYYPGVSIVNEDETEPNLAGTERAIILDPLAKVQGTFTPDDMNDLATKLAIAMNVMLANIGMNASFSKATLINMDFDDMFRTNDTTSGSYLVLSQYIPSVIAGLTGFDLGILSYGQGNIALEVDIQIVDNSNTNGVDKFIAPGQPGAPVGIPAVELKIPGAM
jgi:hypothetical protein